MGKQGLYLCAKYSIAPNFFGYCGPRKTNSLIDHLRENIADGEITNILSDFETLYPYLQLIARENRLKDPFDSRVVEAYWLGNSFLKPLSALEYEAFTKEKLFLDKKLNKIDFGKIMTKVDNYQFLPHHAFHVFNIFKRTGNDPNFHTIETMDNCRIGWGKLKNIQYPKSNSQNIIIETRQLTINNQQLSLGKTINKKIKVNYKGESFLKNLKIGDGVSFHWGFVCDLLTERQVKNLEFYTQRAIEFYNE